ncbi:ExeM/NucH family extracellular endonuclease [Ideonella sp.]|uniref:ExeM/NucH family extracellular endonuclease n=1 Tax=Ideonella sp. TaxID=1929293 RepID=UPI003BB7C774
MKFHPLAAAAALFFVAQSASAGLVISQVYGGGGSTSTSPVPSYKYDYVELFNNGSSPVSLSGLSLQYASSAGSFNAAVTLGTGSVPAGVYFLVRLGSASNFTGADITNHDLAATAPAMSGSSGKIALVNSTTALACGATGTSAVPCSTGQTALFLDLVGYGSSATLYEGAGATATLSTTTAAIRAAAGCTDTNVNSADFVAGTPAPRSSASAVVTCSDSGGGGGGPTATPRTIPEIQGSGSSSAFVGQLVSTSGVVTKKLNNGFFMQALVGDNNAATSDGILVFTSSAPTVNVGEHVQLTATVAEFNTGASTNADTLAHTVTELTGPTAISVISTNNVITPTIVALPEAANDDLERHEGMLVTLTGPLTVSQNYFQGRYGQVTLSADGRMEVPTNRHRPGTTDALNLADKNARSRIILDDGTSLQNVNPTPYMGADDTLRAGDTVASVTGVVDYGLATSSNTGFGDYRIHPTVAPVITRTNARTAAPAAVGGNVKVASFNVLNYFTTFTNGQTASGGTGQGCTLGGASSAANCRGASDITEFNRQKAKIVEAISAINADVLGLMEIQNNGSTAVQNLVDGLNARLGAGTYAVIPDPAAGTGTDAIKVAMIYKPARLSRVGASLSDTDAINNRSPLAQTFAAANGEKFTLVVNHLKSKGSCPAAGDADAAGNTDSGDGQGCWNALRVSQAQRLNTWVGGTLTAATPNVLMLGDFNAYAKEDPIHALTSLGYVDQIGRYNSFGYSYVFDGAAGRLDHAISTAALSPKVTKAIDWHINADEPSIIDYLQDFKVGDPVASHCTVSCSPDYYSATAYRSSDHDPVVLGLDLSKLIAGTTGRDVLTGSAGDDKFTGGAGADTLTGGAGVNTYAYTSIRDAADTITDFVPGKDLIDLRALLSGLGWAGTDPVADGLVKVINTANGAALQIDTDGPAGTVAFRTLVTLRGVTASSLVFSRDVIVNNASARATQRQRKSI